MIRLGRRVFIVLSDLDDLLADLLWILKRGRDWSCWVSCRKISAASEFAWSSHASIVSMDATKASESSPIFPPKDFGCCCSKAGLRFHVWVYWISSAALVIACALNYSAESPRAKRINRKKENNIPFGGHTLVLAKQIRNKPSKNSHTDSQNVRRKAAIRFPLQEDRRLH